MAMHSPDEHRVDEQTGKGNLVMIAGITVIMLVLMAAVILYYNVGVPRP